MWKNFLNKCCLLMHVLIFLVFQLACIVASIKYDNSLDPTNRHIRILNSFTGSLVHVINFPGLNIKFTEVSLPIPMYRYFSKHDTRLIFPFETFSIQIDYLYKHFGTNMTLINYINAVLENLGKKYIGQYSTHSFRSSSKSLNCEAHIYLQPPTEAKSPGPYYNGLTWESLIKDPF